LKGVFDIRPETGYDDTLGVRYHFPRQYLSVAMETIGDWIIYREPRRTGGRQAYVGAARVRRIVPDQATPGHFYAHLQDFFPFPSLVLLNVNGRYGELPLREIRSGRVGAYLQGKSIRLLADEDFDAIVLAGLSQTLAPENAVRLGLDLTADESPPAIGGFSEEITRRVEQMLVNRKIRDANFRLQVCDAYNSQCAVTGLKILNGGGRAEVQAAHIRPVNAGGPDVVQNGIALSATVHWLFDRHLISITDDYRLLVSHNKVPAELRNLFRPGNEPIGLPTDRSLWPAPVFLAHHREAFAGTA
jgi:putative restriction endonuclease